MSSSRYFGSPDWRSRSTSPPAHYDFHCFISYTTRESEVQQIKPLVDTFVQQIREADVSVCPIFYDGWYLERRRYGIRELSARLRDGIERSAFTVAFLAPGYIESEWCRFEWAATSDAHSMREVPATSYSIYPLLWKPVDRFYFRRTRREMLNRVKTRMSWQRTPFLPNLGEAVDLTHYNSSDPWTGAPLALWQALRLIPDYLDQWYPDREWKHVQPIKRLYS